MSDPNARFQTVNVEQIMAQIRARIRERRGADHADEQIRELASARIAGLVGSDPAHAEMLERLRRGVAATPDGAPLDDSMLYGRPGPLRWIRRLLSPILGLFLSPKGMVRALGQQGDAGARHEQSSAVLFQLVENLVLETTRLEVEVKKLEMRLESQATRFDFAERRARSLEGMVRSRSDQPPERENVQGRAPREQSAPVPASAVAQPAAGRDAEPAGGSEARRRRRRRRGRRGPNRAPGENAPGGAEQAPAGSAEQAPAGGDGAQAGEAAVTSGAEAPAPEPRDETPPTPPEHDDNDQ